ncbi:MAG: hypothetical protein QM813_11870 [Verrucomicrobiota bacterium]
MNWSRLREFDPMTQISREEITEVTLPPAGELGILKTRRAGEKAKPGNTHDSARIFAQGNHFPVV